MRELGADGGDFVPAVTLDDDRNVANGNADDAWDASLRLALEGIAHA